MAQYGKPVLIDLDGDGVEIAGADENTVLFDIDDEGLIHRSAWAATDKARQRSPLLLAA